MILNEISKTKLSDGLTKVISKTIDDESVVIDFICAKPKVSMQRTFKNTNEGKKELEELEKSITNIKELLKHMGL